MVPKSRSTPSRKTALDSAADFSPAACAREADEVLAFVRLRFDEETLFPSRIARSAQALRDLVAFARRLSGGQERDTVAP